LYIVAWSLALNQEECQKPGADLVFVEGPRSHSLDSGGLIKMKLKPLGDRLIVRAIEEEETTASGLVLPDTAKEKPQKGKVVAAGDGRLDDDGKRIPLDVKEGDEVLYSKYGGTEIKVEGEDLLVLRESDVLAKIT
jgi:chaperonin GroES